MEISVLKNSGEDTGRKITLSDDIFGIEPNDHAIYLDVKQYLANQRQGTHKSKERNEIAGSTKKIKRQKGTGTARAGSIKSPIFRGGGRVFGPQPRDYSFKLNKKLKSLARKSALAYKAKDNGLVVLEDINFESPKTKDFVKVLNGLSVADKKTLLVLPDSANKNVVLSGRNVKNAKITTADSLNTYDVLNADSLLISESSIEKLENLLK
ncbi:MULTISPECIES: 50S ribosomal protein L4 [Roseivirga]|jgi:large subunit ribosomal protein L4|uniref:Large ribosomal subunit protein uL4 n=1 Tax=Roseivirga spongicola TaxID=333140 RepID=A0A150X967_9BACT|nr:MULTISPECIES: 50S ribosomal protein L4 [Roseivirga]PWL27481.1 MAG: 50S ribosomal protein L4 [Roseivirga sp. XM-24bin3]KYG75268.1 50S ribosomal protein L4 [Roseivirga spongicola]MBO6494885.1 50S ribosomal protein L4 [Roseivirga sp.]MBO6661947.1 50S ribosomal protein L4 [Roseivirga sp.]MBO6909464.1 50S ribosomal protein L4 [Roseivirga sp.]